VDVRAGAVADGAIMEACASVEEVRAFRRRDGFRTTKGFFS
jgi:hypothetical protein